MFIAMIQAMNTQRFAYASVSNAQAMRPATVGGFVRKVNPKQVVFSGSPLEIKNAKIERRNVCQATAAPGVSMPFRFCPRLTQS
jgi:hypothetical protein